MSRRIEDYAMIGDCRSCALVSRDGSIDWLCWPRFDSAACFAALLGTDENGCWRIAPVGEFRAKRRYRDTTMVLETGFETEGGAVTLVDFMPMHDGPGQVIRLVTGLRGKVRMRFELVLRFDYGRTIPWVTRGAHDELHAIAGPDRVVLRAPVSIRGENMRSLAEFEVAAGTTVPFTLVHGPSHLPPPEALDAQAALETTVHEQTEWISHCADAGEWSDALQRSLVTLRGLTYRPTGGIVAAATTSLPERIGGPRNWDYRYCWVRDATFTLLALMNAGYYDEAEAWSSWIVRAMAGHPKQLQIMYGVAGERLLPELELPWLPGYEGSVPVRIGNAAAGQMQLDVYGELADAMTQARKGGLRAAHKDARAMRRGLLRNLEDIWQKPDQGIWEIRGDPQHFVHSKVMAWLAFQRAAQDESPGVDPGDRAHWADLAARIHAEVCERGFDAAQNSFVQAYGAPYLDASLLLLPIVGFLPPEDPRIAGTVAAIERTLLVDGLVKRYQTRHGVDGLPPGEGAFLACSFWLADNYVMLDRMDDARRLFEHLLSLRNDVGLLAEEYDPAAQRMLGNFPQAFSHIALIDTALNLTRAQNRSPSKQRASGEAGEAGAPAPTQ
ncbi:MAG TPA: glycoside hydrolase family 15 protein [Rhodanobacteraceae bacterium]|nr:glycoside hydrolase family 15 protein [Rhodanobacteraceae bacterium]